MENFTDIFGDPGGIVGNSYNSVNNSQGQRINNPLNTINYENQQASRQTTGEAPRIQPNYSVGEMNDGTSFNRYAPGSQESSSISSANPYYSAYSSYDISQSNNQFHNTSQQQQQHFTQPNNSSSSQRQMSQNISKSHSAAPSFQPYPSPNAVETTPHPITGSHSIPSGDPTPSPMNNMYSMQQHAQQSTMFNPPHPTSGWNAGSPSVDFTAQYHGMTGAGNGSNPNSLPLSGSRFPPSFSPQISQQHWPPTSMGFGAVAQGGGELSSPSPFSTDQQHPSLFPSSRSFPSTDMNLMNRAPVPRHMVPGGSMVGGVPQQTHSNFHHQQRMNYEQAPYPGGLIPPQYHTSGQGQNVPMPGRGIQQPPQSQQMSKPTPTKRSRSNAQRGGGSKTATPQIRGPVAPPSEIPLEYSSSYAGLHMPPSSHMPSPHGYPVRQPGGMMQQPSYSGSRVSNQSTTVSQSDSMFNNLSGAPSSAYQMGGSAVQQNNPPSHPMAAYHHQMHGGMQPRGGSREMQQYFKQFHSQQNPSNIPIGAGGAVNPPSMTSPFVPPNPSLGSQNSLKQLEQMVIPHSTSGGGGLDNLNSGQSSSPARSVAAPPPSSHQPVGTPLNPTSSASISTSPVVSNVQTGTTTLSQASQPQGMKMTPSTLSEGGSPSRQQQLQQSPCYQTQYPMDNTMLSHHNQPTATSNPQGSSQQSGNNVSDACNNSALMPSPYHFSNQGGGMSHSMNNSRMGSSNNFNNMNQHPPSRSSSPSLTSRGNATHISGYAPPPPSSTISSPAHPNMEGMNTSLHQQQTQSGQKQSLNPQSFMNQTSHSNNVVQHQDTSIGLNSQLGDQTNIQRVDDATTGDNSKSSSFKSSATSETQIFDGSLETTSMRCTEYNDEVKPSERESKVDLTEKSTFTPPSDVKSVGDVEESATSSVSRMNISEQQYRDSVPTTNVPPTSFGVSDSSSLTLTDDMCPSSQKSSLSVSTPPPACDNNTSLSDGSISTNSTSAVLTTGSSDSNEIKADKSQLLPVLADTEVSSCSEPTADPLNQTSAVSPVLKDSTELKDHQASSSMNEEYEMKSEKRKDNRNEEDLLPTSSSSSSTLCEEQPVASSSSSVSSTVTTTTTQSSSSVVSHGVSNVLMCEDEKEEQPSSTTCCSPLPPVGSGGEGGSSGVAADSSQLTSPPSVASGDQVAPNVTKRQEADSSSGNSNHGMMAMNNFMLPSSSDSNYDPTHFHPPTFPPQFAGHRFPVGPHHHPWYDSETMGHQRGGEDKIMSGGYNRFGGFESSLSSQNTQLSSSEARVLSKELSELKDQLNHLHSLPNNPQLISQISDLQSRIQYMETQSKTNLNAGGGFFGPIPIHNAPGLSSRSSTENFDDHDITYKMMDPLPTDHGVASGKPSPPKKGRPFGSRNKVKGKPRRPKGFKNEGIEEQDTPKLSSPMKVMSTENNTTASHETHKTALVPSDPFDFHDSEKSDNENSLPCNDDSVKIMNEGNEELETLDPPEKPSKIQKNFSIDVASFSSCPGPIDGNGTTLVLKKRKSTGSICQTSEEVGNSFSFHHISLTPKSGNDVTMSPVKNDEEVDGDTKTEELPEVKITIPPPSTTTVGRKRGRKAKSGNSTASLRKSQAINKSLMQFASSGKRGKKGHHAHDDDSDDVSDAELEIMSARSRHRIPPNSSSTSSSAASGTPGGVGHHQTSGASSVSAGTLASDSPRAVRSNRTKPKSYNLDNVDDEDEEDSMVDHSGMMTSDTFPESLSQDALTHVVEHGDSHHQSQNNMFDPLLLDNSGLAFIHGAAETAGVQAAGRVVQFVLGDRIRKVPMKYYEDIELSENNDELTEETKSKVPPTETDKEIEEFYVKYKLLSYLHCEWATEDDLLLEDKRASPKIKRYKLKKAKNLLNSFCGEDELFNPDYVEVDRIIDMHEEIITIEEDNHLVEIIDQKVNEKEGGETRSSVKNSEKLVDVKSDVASHCDDNGSDRKPPAAGTENNASHSMNIDTTVEPSAVKESTEKEGHMDVGNVVDSIRTKLEENEEPNEKIKKEEKKTILKKSYLVKWRSLPYEDATWEYDSDLAECQEKINQFHRFSSEETRRLIAKSESVKMPRNSKDWKKMEESPFFKNDNQLRSYQLEGLNWLLFSWHNHTNCLLADEMGLGKTIQSLAFVDSVYKMHDIAGPFLVIVPLSTISNWQREFEMWTDMNVIVYHGSQTSRNIINQYEMFFPSKKYDNQLESEDVLTCKFNVLITTYECVITDILELSRIKWRICVIDEAHRLKNQKCKLSEGLRLLNIEYRLLLSGTPLQNNVTELFSLLSFLEPTQFSSLDDFLKDFGDMQNEQQVKKLQAVLKPLMLRRMKDDVEKSLKPKEETIVEVEMTNIQKKYYRGILERNFSFLKNSATNANLPNLMNTMMELRKCCIHPYLLNGAEQQIQDDYRSRKSDFSDNDGLYFNALINSSGKMVFLDKLLPKLRKGGHRVLIFSQMVKLLDILEDYLVRKLYPYERIDGSIRGNMRQAAIDRYCRSDSDRFVFLLCTKAGGLGINLVAADTCIIYDSDWNPQNDLQAQARCHRIGQQKSVKIYRLITSNTYERHMFDKASLKLGLDKAVLQSMNTEQLGTSGGNTSHQGGVSKKEIEDLLKKGAYGAVMDDENAADKFCEEDIEDILQRRTQTLTLDGYSGGGFSKASFASADTESDISIDDVDFWAKWAKKADIDTTLSEKSKQLVFDEGIQRSRKKIQRFDNSLLSSTSNNSTSLNSGGGGRCNSRGERDENNSAKPKSDRSGREATGHGDESGHDNLLHDDSDDSDASSSDDLVPVKKKGKSSKKVTSSSHPHPGGLDDDDYYGDSGILDSSSVNFAAGHMPELQPVIYGEWPRNDLFRLEKGLLAFGWGRWPDIRKYLGLTTKSYDLKMIEELCRVIALFCVSAFRGDESVRQFVAELIKPPIKKQNMDEDANGSSSPKNDVMGDEDVNVENTEASKDFGKVTELSVEDKESEIASQLLSRYQIAFSTPVPRGGRKKKNSCGGGILDDEPVYLTKTERVMNSLAATSTSTYDVIQKLIPSDICMKWAEDCEKFNAHSLLDKVYQKHLLRHCNKILLRFRLLFYIERQMLQSSLDQVRDVNIQDCDIDLPILSCDILPSPNWNEDLDKSLIVGTYRHGFERYYKMRKDPKLAFVRHFPLEKNTEKMEAVAQFPSIPELNGRLRRLVAAFQRQLAIQIEQQMHIQAIQHATHSVDKKLQALPKVKIVVKSPPIPIHEKCPLVVVPKLTQEQHSQFIWTLLQKGVYYSSISTSPHIHKSHFKDFLYPKLNGNIKGDEFKIDWSNSGTHHSNSTSFKSSANLKHISDDSLSTYYYTFINKCHGFIRGGGENENVERCSKEEKFDLMIKQMKSNITTQQNEKSHSSKCSNDILDGVDVHTIFAHLALFTAVRFIIISRKIEDETFRKCLRVLHYKNKSKGTLATSNFLPSWWTMDHDKDLLVGVSKHGLPKDVYVHFLNDTSLTAFQDVLQKHLTCSNDTNLTDGDVTIEPSEESKELTSETNSSDVNAVSADKQRSYQKTTINIGLDSPPSPDTLKAIEDAVAQDARSRRRTTKEASHATRLALEASKLAAMGASKRHNSGASTGGACKRSRSGGQHTTSDKIESENVAGGGDENGCFEDPSGVVEEQTRLSGVIISVQAPNDKVDDASEEESRVAITVTDYVMDDLMCQTYASQMKWPLDKILKARVIQLIHVLLFQQEYETSCNVRKEEGDEESLPLTVIGSKVDLLNMDVVKCMFKYLHDLIGESMEFDDVSTAAADSTENEYPDAARSGAKNCESGSIYDFDDDQITNVDKSMKGRSSSDNSLKRKDNSTVDSPTRGEKSVSKKKKRLNDIMAGLGAKKFTVKSSPTLSHDELNNPKTEDFDEDQKTTALKEDNHDHLIETNPAEQRLQQCVGGVGQADAKVQKWLADQMGVIPDRPHSPSTPPPGLKKIHLDSTGELPSTSHADSPAGSQTLVTATTTTSSNKTNFTTGDCIPSPSSMNWLTNVSGDELVSVVNRTDGKKLEGVDGPKLSCLAQWLTDHPTYDIDHAWAESLKKKYDTTCASSNPAVKSTVASTKSGGRGNISTDKGGMLQQQQEQQLFDQLKNLGIDPSVLATDPMKLANALNSMDMDSFKTICSMLNVKSSSTASPSTKSQSGNSRKTPSTISGSNNVMTNEIKQQLRKAASSYGIDTKTFDDLVNSDPKFLNSLMASTDPSSMAQFFMPLSSGSNIGASEGTSSMNDYVKSLCKISGIDEKTLQSSMLNMPDMSNLLQQLGPSGSGGGTAKGSPTSVVKSSRSTSASPSLSTAKISAKTTSQKSVTSGKTNQQSNSFENPTLFDANTLAKLGLDMKDPGSSMIATMALMDPSFISAANSMGIKLPQISGKEQQLVPHLKSLGIDPSLLTSDPATLEKALSSMDLSSLQNICSSLNINSKVAPSSPKTSAKMPTSASSVERSQIPLAVGDEMKEQFKNAASKYGIDGKTFDDLVNSDPKFLTNLMTATDTNKITGFPANNASSKGQNTSVSSLLKSSSMTDYIKSFCKMSGLDEQTVHSSLLNMPDMSALLQLSKQGTECGKVAPGLLNAMPSPKEATKVTGKKRSNSTKSTSSNCNTPIPSSSSSFMNGLPSIDSKTLATLGLDSKNPESNMIATMALMDPSFISAAASMGIKLPQLPKTKSTGSLKSRSASPKPSSPKPCSSRPQSRSGLTSAQSKTHDTPFGANTNTSRSSTPGHPRLQVGTNTPMKASCDPSSNDMLTKLANMDPQILSAIALMDHTTLQMHQENPNSPLHTYLTDPAILNLLMKSSPLLNQPLTLPISSSGPTIGGSSVAKPRNKSIDRGGTPQSSDGGMGVKSPSAKLSMPPPNKLPANISTQFALDQLDPKILRYFDDKSLSVLGLNSENIMDALKVVSTKCLDSGSSRTSTPVSSKISSPPVSTDSTLRKCQDTVAKLMSGIDSKSSSFNSKSLTRLEPSPNIKPKSSKSGGHSSNFPKGLPGIDPKLLAGIDLKSLSTIDPNLLSTIDPNLFAGLDPKLLAGIDLKLPSGVNPNLLSGMDPKVLANLDSMLNQRVTDISISDTPTRLSSQLDSHFLSGIDPKLLSGIDPQLLANLDPKALSAIDPRLVADLDSKLLGGLDPKHSASMDSKLLGGLDPRLLAGFDPKLLAGLDPKLLSGIDPKLMSGIDSKLLASSDPKTMTGTDPKLMVGLDPKLMAGLDPKLMAGLDPKLMAGLDPKLMAGLDPKLMAGLDPKLIAGLDPKLMVGLDPKLMAGLDTKLLTGLDPKLLAGLDPKFLAGLDPKLMTGFDPKLTAGFDPKLLAGLDPKLMAGLDPKLLTGLDPKLLASFDPKFMSGFDGSMLAGIDLKSLAGSGAKNSAAAMNLAGLDPKLLLGIDPKLLSGIDPKLLTSLGSKLIAGLDTKSMSGVDPKLLSSLDLSLLSGLESKLVSDVKSSAPKHVSSGSSGVDEAVGKSSVDLKSTKSGFDQIFPLSDHSLLSSMDPRLSGLDTKLLSGLDPNLLLSLDPKLLHGLISKQPLSTNTALSVASSTKSSAFQKEQSLQKLNGDAKEQVTNDQSNCQSFLTSFASSDSKQSAPSMSTTDSKLLSGLNPNILSRLDPKLLTGLDPKLLTGLDPKLLTGLDPQLLTGLDPKLLTGLDPKLLTGLDPKLLTQFDPKTFSGLDLKLASGLDAKALGGIDSKLIQCVDPKLIPGFDPKLLSVFESQNLPGLDTSVFPGSNTNVRNDNDKLQVALDLKSSNNKPFSSGNNEVSNLKSATSVPTSGSMSGKTSSPLEVNKLREHLCEIAGSYGIDNNTVDAMLQADPKLLDLLNEASQSANPLAKSSVLESMKAFTKSVKVDEQLLQGLLNKKSSQTESCTDDTNLNVGSSLHNIRSASTVNTPIFSTITSVVQPSLLVSETIDQQTSSSSVDDQTSSINLSTFTKSANVMEKSNEVTVTSIDMSVLANLNPNIVTSVISTPVTTSCNETISPAFDLSVTTTSLVSTEAPTTTIDSTQSSSVGAVNSLPKGGLTPEERVMLRENKRQRLIKEQHGDVSIATISHQSPSLDESRQKHDEDELLDLSAKNNSSDDDPCSNTSKNDDDLNDNEGSQPLEVESFKTYVESTENVKLTGETKDDSEKLDIDNVSPPIDDDNAVVNEEGVKDVTTDA